MSESVLAELSDVPLQGAGGLQVQVGDVPVGLFRVGDDVVGWRSVCPHAAAPVCRGTVDGTRLPSAVYRYAYGRDREVLQCPWHGWEFDLVTGEHLAEGSSARMRRHPVRVADGRVYDASAVAAVDLTLKIEQTSRPTARVLILDLVSVDGARLPAWAPGSHLEIVLPSGLVRHYSLCGDPRDRGRYRIAILREPDGRGGSEELHREAAVGLPLLVTSIRNRFPMTVAERYLFIAGGIGITPLLPMIEASQRRRMPFRILYTGKDRESMLHAEELSRIPGARVVETGREARADVRGLIRDAAQGTAVVACGPESLLDDVRAAVADTPQTLELHTETFRPTQATTDGELPGTSFVVRLARSGASLAVPADRSILSTLRDAGVPMHSSCEDGWCGSCETRVLGGIPDHRDSVLTDAERESGATMMVCVGRARSDELVLDL